MAVKTHRKKDALLATYYVTVDGKWRIWREPYDTKRWYVNSLVDKDKETEVTEGFATKWMAMEFVEEKQKELLK